MLYTFTLDNSAELKKVLIFANSDYKNGPLLQKLILTEDIKNF